MDLENVDLSGQNLRGVKLERANLQEANLQEADLQEAYLKGAKLQGADLRRADLEGAYLEGAYLEGAYLEGAYLEGANLRGADLTNSTLLSLEQVSAAIVDESTKNSNLKPLSSWLVGRGNERPTESYIRELERARAETKLQASQLKAELNKAKDDGKKRAQLEKEVADKNAQLKKQNAEFELQQNELDRLKEGLNQGIDDSMDAIEGSIEQTDKDITSYRYMSKILTQLGLSSYVLTVLAGIWVAKYFGFDHPITTVHWASQWVAIATPLVLAFSIGTALLRHDAKIRQRYEHLSDKKHQLEKASGVLLASKHLSQVENFNDDRHRVIVETFEAARDSLLNGKPSDNKSESETSVGQEQAIINTLIRELTKKATS